MKIYLDLLPEQQKIEIKRKKRFHTIIQQELLFLLPVLVVVVMLVAANMILKIQKTSTVMEVEQAQKNDSYRELKKYEDAFSEANAFAIVAGKIQTNQLHWAAVFRRIADIIPEGVSVDSVATRELQILMAGKAKSRDNILEFKEKLMREESCFENVNIPLSNLVVRDNVVFQLDFNVKESCLKEK